MGLHFEVDEPEGRWRLDEEDVPEIPLHDQVIELLKLILKAFVARSARDALVTSNLGCRWDPADARVGTDPDVVLIEPAPPEGALLSTLRVWEPGHVPPRVAVEVVSENTADKDYLEAPLRCARLGVNELWVFDPLRLGPASTGGPFALQVWRKAGEGMSRTYAGEGPGRSEELGAFLVVTEGGRMLRLADDAEGKQLWPTTEEEQARRADQAEARVRALEEKLRALEGREEG